MIGSVCILKTSRIESYILFEEYYWGYFNSKLAFVGAD